MNFIICKHNTPTHFCKECVIESYKASLTKAVEEMIDEENGTEDFSSGKIVAYDRVLNLIS